MKESKHVNESDYTEEEDSLMPSDDKPPLQSVHAYIKAIFSGGSLHTLCILWIENELMQLGQWAFWTNNKVGQT